MEREKEGRREMEHLKETWTHLQYTNTHLYMQTICIKLNARYSQIFLCGKIKTLYQGLHQGSRESYEVKF